MSANTLRFAIDHQQSTLGHGCSHTGRLANDGHVHLPAKLLPQHPHAVCTRVLFFCGQCQDKIEREIFIVEVKKSLCHGSHTSTGIVAPKSVNVGVRNGRNERIKRIGRGRLNSIEVRVEHQCWLCSVRMRLSHDQVVPDAFHDNSFLVKELFQITAPLLFLSRKGGDGNQFSQQFCSSKQLFFIHWRPIRLSQIDYKVPGCCFCFDPG